MINLLQNLPQVDLSQTLRQSLPTAERISQWDNIGRQNAMRGMLSDYANNPNAKADDYLAIAQQYPELVDQFKPAWQGLDEQEKKQKQSFMSQLNMSLYGGDQEQALQLIDDQMKTYQEKNDNEEIGGLMSLKNLIEQNPDQAKQATLLAYYSGITPEQREIDTAKLNQIKSQALQAQASASLSMSNQQINEAKFPTDMKKSQAQAQLYGAQALEATGKAGNLANENYYKQANIDLKKQELENASQNINLGFERLNKDSAGEQTSAEKTKTTELFQVADEMARGATQANVLASKFEKASYGGGSQRRWIESGKNIFSGQDEVTNLISDYNRFKNSEVVRGLPSGGTSDKDVMIFSQGFPPDNASPAYMAQFLRGFAKMKQYEATTANLAASYRNENRNLAPARNSFYLKFTPPQGKTIKVKVNKGDDWGAIQNSINEQAQKIILGVSGDGQQSAAPGRPPRPAAFQNAVQRFRAQSGGQ